MLDASHRDQELFNHLLAEVTCLQETIQALETDSVSLEDTVGLISGIQRDIVHLYRASQP